MLGELAARHIRAPPRRCFCNNGATFSCPQAVQSHVGNGESNVSNGNDTEDVGPDEAYRRSVHASERAELLKRHQANSDAHDKAILTLSSGFLALSLSFIKEIVPVGLIEWSSLLYASWVALTVAVLATVISFRVSEAALDDALDRTYRYYILRDESAFAPGALSAWVGRLNNASAGLFCLGVILTVIFAGVNFSETAHVTKPLSGGAEHKTVTVPQERVSQFQRCSRSLRAAVRRAKRPRKSRHRPRSNKQQRGSACDRQGAQNRANLRGRRTISSEDASSTAANSQTADDSANSQTAGAATSSG